MRWVCGMKGAACGHGVTRAASAFTRRATLNLLTRFAKGPSRGLLEPVVRVLRPGLRRRRVTPRSPPPAPA
ncbi:hypothetical protein ACFSTC_40810 [Nonomuraea ferruginea]